MISAGSVESDSNTAPSTDCSASRFCGGASGAALKPLPLWVGALMRAAESRRGCGRTHVRPRYVQRFRRRPPVNDEAPAFGPALRLRLGVAGGYCCSTTMVLTVAIT